VLSISSALGEVFWGAGNAYRRSITACGIWESTFAWDRLGWLNLFDTP